MASALPPRQTLSANLMACLDQEDMVDLHLLASDGSKIPAFRNILACQSSVLRTMLYGDFEESKSDEVKLGYDGDALRALVEFCITDDVHHFDSRVDEIAARGVVQLVACAHFLNMPFLQEKAQALVNHLLKSHKFLACIIYDEASIYGEPTESVKVEALAVTRKDPEESLSSRPQGLRSEVLSELIRDDEMVREEITLFRALHRWATTVNEVGKSGALNAAERLNVAKGLAATHIRLSSIKPTDLIGIVRKSCLVDERIISEALESQAVLAEKKSDIQFSKKRKKLIQGITVSGAGRDITNGFYEEDGESDNHPKYTKKCLWRGEERVFVICRVEKENVWIITIAGDNGEPGDEENDFYRGLGNSIPEDGWWLAPLGVSPCPVCQKS